MNRRDFLRTAGLGLAAGLVPRAAYALGSGARPNFVFFLVDDLGWSDVQCYGAERYETPHIDRLAANGMRFTDAYAACTVCSPTRASIMTGKYPARLHLTDWISGHIRPYAKLRVPRWRAYLPLEEVTIAEALKTCGYRTFFAGKWHLGDKKKYFPEHQGFDTNIAGNGSGAPWSGYFSPYRNRQIVDGPKGEYLTDRLGDESVKFLESVGDDPFFLYLPFYSVHTPIMGKPDVIQRLRRRHPSLKGQIAEYAAMIASVDENVGKVLAKLDGLGIAEDTVVFFMSDNGGMFGNRPLRMGKGSAYEGGVREPMIVRWPGTVAPDSVCSTPVTSTDFYPTMLQIAGRDLNPAQHADGASLVPLLTGRDRLEREAIYWHYPHYHRTTPYGAVRKGDYKLIEFYEDMRVELYDLKRDIGESTDLASSTPEKAAELKALLHAWRRSVGAQMPTPNPDYDPARVKEKPKGPERRKWIEEHLELG